MYNVPPPSHNSPLSIFPFHSFGFFQDRVSLCTLQCPGTCSVCQAGFKLTASASQVLGLNVCTTTGESLSVSVSVSVSVSLYFMFVSTILLPSDTPEEGIGSHYRWLWATTWLLGIELRTFGRAVSALNCWTDSPVLSLVSYFYICLFKIHCVCVCVCVGLKNLVV